MPRYVTKHKDIPGVSMGYPTYVVWDTQEDSIAGKDGLLLIFSSMTGEIACGEANKMTAELNGQCPVCGANEWLDNRTHGTQFCRGCGTVK